MRVMATICLILLASGIAAQEQTEAAKPGPEYDVLNAWTGSWVVLGEARDTPTGVPYRSEWTFSGRRILRGFFLEVRHREKYKNRVKEFLEITGYDPIEKACFSHISFDNGGWEISSPKFVDERTCVDIGTTYYPDGRTRKWRFTWTFSLDGRSVLIKEEDEADGKWWTAYEGKGIKSPERP